MRMFYIVSAPFLLVDLFTFLLTLYGLIVGFNRRILVTLLRWNFAGNLGLFLVNNAGSFIMLLSDPDDDSQNYTKEFFITAVQLFAQLPIVMSTFIILHYLIKILD